jgi:hypothetical protein
MRRPDAAHPHLQRFLDAVHRRAVLLRVAERSALGLAAGMAAASVLAALLWWQGRSAGTAVAGLAALGTACGLTWALARRPSRLDAAMLADTQLDLDDLLGTAAALSTGRSSSDDAWSATILQLADARCRAIRPRDVVLSRLGVRAWGGVGLSTALALTLAMLAGTSADPAVADIGNARPSAVRTAPPAVDRPLIAIADDAARPAKPRGDPQHEGNSTAGPTTEQNATPATAPAAPAAGETGHRAASTGGTDGVGGGSSSSNPPSPAPADNTLPASPATRPATLPGGDVALGDGTAARSTSPGPATRPAGRTAGASDDRQPASAPWNRPDWADDVRTARQRIESGDVPAAYRDLLRSYFDVK